MTNGKDYRRSDSYKKLNSFRIYLRFPTSHLRLVLHPRVRLESAKMCERQEEKGTRAMRKERERNEKEGGRESEKKI